MKTFLHIAALILALVMAGRASAVTGQAVMVCKFTGKVMKGCPCPMGEESGAQWAKSDCCELRQAESQPVASALPHPATHLASMAWIEPEAREQLRPSAASGAPTPTPGTSPPRGGKLFIELQQLLL